MKRVRVIPLILIDGGRAVVTRKFGNPVYVGDPVNIIRILNDKEVDEVIVLDITSKKKQSAPDFALIEHLASESFMPLGYGGHIRSMADVEQIISCGVEKVSFNSGLINAPRVIQEVAGRFGKQSVIASIDLYRNWLGKWKIRISGAEKTPELRTFLDYIVRLGVGEIVLNVVDRDGTLSGYELTVIREVSSQVKIPVIACGGAHRLEDFESAIKHGASAVAAGAMFYFKGSFNAVLINYPDSTTLKEKLYRRL